jgi:phosphoenolpyruvate carboxykinase (ATP)
MLKIEPKFTHQKIDLSTEQLLKAAIDNGEGEIASNAAFAVKTGERTGRSPNDRFIVKQAITEHAVAWGGPNKSISPTVFNTLWDKAIAYLQTKTVYGSHLKVGAENTCALPVYVITELAWHALFVNHLFIQLDANEQVDDQKAWTMINAAQLHLTPEVDGVHSDAAVMIDFEGKRVLLCGTGYAGEMKKAMFSALNFLLPEQDILSMHCAANEGDKGDVALFFGLSGTGKTTLSGDPERFLIGDDEHGWSESGIFNFEGGCYAKCIHLSPEKEPVIWDALKHGAVMENVVMAKDTKIIDFSDASLSQNTRAAYPRTHIEKRVPANKAGVPQAVIFLTCDLYGVLPPVAKLSKEQAAYYFLSGYTSLIGGTEVGQAAGVKPTFSTCFGAPFFPRPAQVYADLLIKRLEETQAPVYLVNTGWTGGAYAKGGTRFDIPVTRAIIRAILSQSIQQAEFQILPGFHLAMPTTLAGVDEKLLDPRKAWHNEHDYWSCAQTLIQQFRENFSTFKVSDAITQAGPRPITGNEKGDAR